MSGDEVRGSPPAPMGLKVLEVGRPRPELPRLGPVLVGTFSAPMRALSSAIFGGGLGTRSWFINVTVPASYDGMNPEVELRQLSEALDLPGPGIGFMTAVDVRAHQVAYDNGVVTVATVGIGHPTLAAAPDGPGTPDVGTINIVVQFPEPLSDAALVNIVATVTEAKVQALADLGFVATGTATDAVCALCPEGRPAARFGGPRSPWGSRAARAVHAAILASSATGS